MKHFSLPAALFSLLIPCASLAQSVSVAGNAAIGGQLSVTNTTNSTSPTTGAATIAGGLGVGGNLNVGGTISGTVSPPTENPNTIYAGPSSGSPATASFRALTQADLPNVTPSGGTTASPLPAILGRVVNVLDYGAVASAATDNSTAINAAIAAAVAAGGGSVILPRGTYGVCAAPVTLAYSGAIHVNLVGDGAKLTLQAGCATPPQEILNVNYSLSPTEYSNNATIQGLTIDGACATKYAMMVTAAQGLVLRNNIIEDPAPAATIAGSAGIYMASGNEREIGKSNWVVAANSCYNTGNLPQYGIYDNGGNDNFTGVIVVNYIDGIWSNGGDNFFGPGTHIWGGCYLNSGGGCTFNSALRTTIGIDLQGAGYTYGVEIDDPAAQGVVMVGTSSNDRMVAVGDECLFSTTPTSSQYCVLTSSTAVGSTMIGIVAPQLKAAGYPQNIAWASNAAVDIFATPYVDTTVNGSPAATCSGSPTTSFAVVNGIVTHC